MQGNNLYRDFMVKLIWRLSGNLIYHVFSMKTQDKLIIYPHYGETHLNYEIINASSVLITYYAVFFICH